MGPCFSVYASTLCAYQPHSGPDMLAYLYVIASAHEEFQFAACMAYEVAFRKKAANFRRSSWGHIDPQIYSKAFTGTTKVIIGVHCSLCLSTSHSNSECPLYSSGPAKRHRPTWLAPKAWSSSTMEKRSASTLIEADGPGRTALVPMPAPSAAVEEHTQLHNAHSSVPPRGKGYKHPYREACIHTTMYNTSTDNIHVSQPCTDMPPHTYSASRLTMLVHNAPPLLPSVVTPVNVQALSVLLTYHPDKEFSYAWFSLWVLYWLCRSTHH